MRALIVCPEAPYPVRGGGSLRTAAMLEYLARRYRLDAIFFAEVGSPDPRPLIPAGLVHDTALIRLPRHSKSAPARLIRNLGRAVRGAPPLEDRFAGFDLAGALPGVRWDLCVVEHFWCAGYAAALRPRVDKLVLDLHNIESALHGRYAETAGPLGPIHRRFSSSAGRLERELLPLFDLVLTASEPDGARVRAYARRAEVYPNTVPLRDIVRPAPRHQIVFAGNMEYQPNIEAVRFFGRGVWPRLAAEHAGLEWVLLGRNPDAVRGLVAALPRVRLTGEVEDALPEIAASRVAIAPILSGSGTRLKILEAWMAGTPVVSTVLGAEGLSYQDGEHLIAVDGAARFGAAIGRLLGDPELAARIGQAGRSHCKRRFTWEAGWKALERLGI